VRALSVPASWRARLISWRLAKLLSQNTIVSCATFLFDMLFLWVLVQFLHVGKYPATAIGFVVATTIHYAVARVWIFRGTTRRVTSGYVYFLINAGIGLVATMAFFALFAGLLGMTYLVARVIASVFAGLAAFLLNAVLNFRTL
jgi:putative flippase GtrA